VAPLLASGSCTCKLNPKLDVVPGGSKGSPLVKIVVKLEEKNGTCSATVDPPTPVVVFRGGVIRWLVENNCTSKIGQELKFTQPQPRHPEKKYEQETPKPWDFRFCSAKIVLVAGKDDKNSLLCEVPVNVVPDVYKYNLDGAAKLDPDIEVRKGG
jgi:hypothetical protein